MTNSCEKNPAVCTRMFLRRLDFLLPSAHNFRVFAPWNFHSGPEAQVMKKAMTLVGVSAAIRSVEEEIDHAARCDAKVLITGESGVGKEIVARLIHEGSARSRGPLITI